MRKVLLLLAVLGSGAGAEKIFAAGTHAVEFLNSGKVLPTNLAFSEAVRVGSMLYLSGQIGIVPGTRKTRLAPDHQTAAPFGSLLALLVGGK